MKPQPSVFAAAVLLMACGALALFMPQELAGGLDRAGAPTSPLVVQLLAGALFAVGMLDWMSRFATIGGIYGRPVVLTNLVLFFTAAMTLVRHAMRVGGAGPWAAFGVSAFFAVWFARIMFLPSPGAKT